MKPRNAHDWYTQVRVNRAYLRGHARVTAAASGAVCDLRRARLPLCGRQFCPNVQVPFSAGDSIVTVIFCNSVRRPGI
jgi:hypothetical protein